MKNKEENQMMEIDFELMHRVVHNGKVIRLKTMPKLKRVCYGLGGKLFRTND
jgi:hypothetical protein